jgi:hypothetical protein
MDVFTRYDCNDRSETTYSTTTEESILITVRCILPGNKTWIIRERNPVQ